MATLLCVCGEVFEATTLYRYCDVCGEPLPVGAEERAARADEIDVVFGYLVYRVVKHGDVELVMAESQGCWTRIEENGRCFIAWYEVDEPEAGIHYIQVDPLGGGGFLLRSTAGEPRRCHTIYSVLELCHLAGMMM